MTSLTYWRQILDIQKTASVNHSEPSVFDELNSRLTNNRHVARTITDYRMINTYSFVFTSEYILYFHLRSALNVLKSAVIENGVQISRIKILQRKMIFSSP